MSIVSSTYVLDGHTQADGRRYVTEKHADSEGVTHELYYLAEAGADYSAIMLSRVAQIENDLAEQEAATIIGSG